MKNDLTQKVISPRLRTLCTLLFLFSFLGLNLSEARIGGGRSMGSRGSRSFGTRSMPTYSRRNVAPPPPTFNQPQAAMPPRYGQPQVPPPMAPRPGGILSGSFAKGFLGGMAGGMLGSMLFRGTPSASGIVGGAGDWGASRSGGGIGILEILVLGGLIYLVYRLFSKSQQKTETQFDSFRRDPDMGSSSRDLSQGSSGAYSSGAHSGGAYSGSYGGATPAPFGSPSQPGSFASQFEENPVFDSEEFKEERMDDFMRIQAAWNHRDLSGVSGLIDLDLKRQFDEDLSKLKSAGRINKVENIAIRNCDLVESWQEDGREYVCLRFKANVTDTVLDEKTGQILEGDPLRPVKFEEDWTFSRPLSDRMGKNWKLAAIEGN